MLTTPKVTQIGEKQLCYIDQGIGSSFISIQGTMLEMNQLVEDYLPESRKWKNNFIKRISISAENVK